MFRSGAGDVVLVGSDARCNDLLTLKLARPYDFFLHVAGQPGSHVILLNRDREGVPEREALGFAASLAAAYSSARDGGRVAVHYAQRCEVSKPRGLAAGRVQLRRYKVVSEAPCRHEDLRVRD